MIDHTPIGPQHVLPGAERVPDRVVAERRWSAPKRSTVPQTNVAGPLFGDGHKQVDIMDLLR